MIAIAMPFFHPPRPRNMMRNLIPGQVSLGLVIIVLAFLRATAGMAEPITITVLGDSLVQGYGLPAEQGFVPQLQHWLNGRDAQITLINAGVSGDTTAGGLARLDWTLADRPDRLVVSLGGNDALRGIDPEQTRANLDAILRRTAELQIPVLLVGIQAPNNFGDTYRQAFEQIFPDLAGQYQTQLYPNFLGVLLKQGDRQSVLDDYFQADALHPNTRGVALIVEDMGPSLLKLAEQTRP